MLATFFLVIVLVAISVVLFAIQILLKKNGKFPDTHIEDNVHLKKYGITCASHDEYECSLGESKSKGCEGCTVSCQVSQL